MGCCCTKKNNTYTFPREFTYTHYEIQQLKDKYVIEKGALRYMSIKTKYLTFQLYQS